MRFVTILRINGSSPGNHIFPRRGWGKSAIILLIILSFFVVYDRGFFLSVYAQNLKNEAKNDKESDSIKTGWSSYSFGLYYKYLAMESRDKAECAEYLDKALHYFSDALSKGDALDSVYDEISDCHLTAERYDASIEFAKKSIEVNPKDAIPYLRIYQIHCKRDNYKEAAEILEAYCVKKPDSFQVKYELGQHYYNRLHDLQKANRAFKDIIALSKVTSIPDYYKRNAYNYLGFIAYRKLAFVSALKYFKRAHSIDHDNLEPIFFIAHINMVLNNFDEAEKYCFLYLQKSDSNLQIHSILGRILYLRDDPRCLYHLSKVKDAQNIEGILTSALYFERLHNDDKALGLLTIVAKYQPREIPLYCALARISVRKNNADEAFKQYFTTGVLLYTAKQYRLARINLEKADTFNNNIPDVQYYLGRSCEEMGSYASAIWHYRKVIDKNQNNELTVHIGYLYGVLKNYNTAMYYLNSVIAREPANHQAYFFSGLLSIWQEHYKDAERNLKIAITLENTEEPYYFYLAITMEKMKRIDKAIDYLKLAIQHDSKSARAYNYLGYIYADNNMMLDESLLLINKALKLEPHNGAYIDSLGWVHYRKKEYKSALEQLLRAEKILGKIASPDPVVYEHIGDTYKEIGQYRKAVNYWRKSVQLEKNEALERKIFRFEKIIKKEKKS